MVYVEYGRQPAYKHLSFESAKAEAERLARETKRQAFVLKTVAACTVSDVKWEQTEGELPF